MAHVRKRSTGGKAIGRKPKSAEPRVTMITRLPESVVARIEPLLSQADVDRSDFLGYCVVEMTNRLLVEHGEEPVSMPTYLKEREAAIRRTPVPPAQEALMTG